MVLGTNRTLKLIYTPLITYDSDFSTILSHYVFNVNVMTEKQHFDV